MVCVMDSDSESRSLGYPSPNHWLDIVSGEAAFQCLQPGRLAEYDRVFTPRRALSQHEADLLKALEVPVDWEWLAEAGYLEDDRLSAAATRIKYVALDLLDRL